MKKYAVELHSLAYNTHVSIAFCVHSDMSAENLKQYYLTLSSKVSDCFVKELIPNYEN